VDHSFKEGGPLGGTLASLIGPFGDLKENIWVFKEGTFPEERKEGKLNPRALLKGGWEIGFPKEFFLGEIKVFFHTIWHKRVQFS